MHCPFSHCELVQTSLVHPNPVGGLCSPTHKPKYLTQNRHDTYLSWHFHSHFKIYCHATSTYILWLDDVLHCYFAYCYTGRSIQFHKSEIFQFELWVLKVWWFIINRVLPLPVRLYIKKEKKPKKKRKERLKRDNKEKGGSISIIYSTLVLMFSTNTSVWREFSYYDLHNYVENFTL